MSDFYNRVYEAGDPKPSGPYGWIQWKGTDVCIDVYCSCGHRMHFDEEFLYYIECGKCKQRFAVGQHVVLIPLTEELVKLGNIEDWQFHTEGEST